MKLIGAGKLNGGKDEEEEQMKTSGVNGMKGGWSSRWRERQNRGSRDQGWRGQSRNGGREKKKRGWEMGRVTGGWTE